MIIDLENEWNESTEELRHLNEAINEAQEAKDESTLSILRKRCVNLHHERISINIQRSKLEKGIQNGETA